MQDDNIRILGVFLEVKSKDYQLIEKIEKKLASAAPAGESPKDQMSKYRSQMQASSQHKNSPSSLQIKKESFLLSKNQTEFYGTQPLQKNKQFYSQIKEDEFLNNENEQQNDNIIESIERRGSSLVNQEIPKRSQIKSNLQLKEKLLMKDSLKFYLKFIGKVQIVVENQLTQVYFRIPSLSNYINEKITLKLEKEALHLSGKSRLELLIQFCDYIKYEMIYQQKISYSPTLSFFVKYSPYEQDIVFFLVMLINVIFLINMKFESGVYKHMSSFFNTLYTILYVLHLIMSFILCVLVMIERYPLLAYYKSMKKRNTNEKIKGFLKKSVLLLSDYECIYQIIYFFISCLALVTPLFYAILLIDIIKRSSDLKEVLRVVSHNYKKLLKIVFLALIVIYIYSIIGMIAFPDSFEQVIQRSPAPSRRLPPAQFYAPPLPAHSSTPRRFQHTVPRALGLQHTVPRAHRLPRLLTRPSMPSEPARTEHLRRQRVPDVPALNHPGTPQPRRNSRLPPKNRLLW